MNAYDDLIDRIASIRRSRRSPATMSLDVLMSNLKAELRLLHHAEEQGLDRAAIIRAVETKYD